ncbi:uncharacterized protein LY79DRAFT_563307 [Colletotrichum navitas]|uniref:CorA-like transporter domain-containing protein n=1 Tax=Colletotrichum navitas TaxID=681940 RepID=A0AAD8V2H4_9PEZI|nr:uncharacterized protein LY79DRAFT_563307 [Colletotrichum navitas]KAK1579744.1 hypothetical protein LY79DRAFT_563307 [Colletotrichum navitas]
MMASSYRSFDLNPRQYLSGTPCGKSALDRLEECRNQLFIKDRRTHSIPVKDISAAGRVEKINLRSDEKLKAFLGDVPTNEIGNASLYRPDAKCRFVNLCAPTTVGPLELSETMQLRLMTFYQIMPQFSDFLLVYASDHGRDRELRFSGFRTDKVLANPVHGTVIPELGRSGRRYQLCFNLKTAALKGREDWKIRQAVLHHQFDLGQGTQLWVIGDPHATLKSRIAALFREGNTYPTSFGTVEEGFRSSLEVHLDFARWATSEWRWHILYLEKKAEEFTKPARIRDKGHIEKLEPENLSDVQNWEERTNDAIMAMESNINILKLQQKFYRDLVKDDDFPGREKHGCTRAVANYDSQLEEHICETQMQIVRAKLLVKMISDRKTILIQHFQTQNAIVSSMLTATMYKQASRSAVEAIAVRIVTIVTLIYLPATFSSTFFSTDIIKYQEGEVFSMVALERFLQVTLPLMFLTFVSSGLWFWIEWRRRARDFLKIRSRLPDVFEPELEKSASKW